MADESMYWRTDDPLVFEIAGETFNLDTKGVDYASQFGKLTAWLGSHGLAALLSGAEDGIFEQQESDTQMLISLISYLMQYGVSPEAMIELGAIVLNTDKSFVEENFDPGWFVDGIITLIDNKPGIKGAVTRLYERFFLAAGEDTGDQEDQAQD